MKFIIYIPEKEIANKVKICINHALPSDTVDLAANCMECFTTGVQYDCAFISESDEEILWKDLMLHLSSNGVKVFFIANVIDNNIIREIKEAKGILAISTSNIDSEVKNIVLKLKEEYESREVKKNFESDTKNEENSLELKTLQDFSLIKSKKYPAVIVSIHGAKGGVGKTSIAANTAVKLATMGYKTAILDFDIENGNLANVLHMKIEKDLKDIIKGNSNYTEATFEQHSSGLYVIPTLKMPAESELITAEVCERILGRLARTFEVIVIDTGSISIDPMLVAMQVATKAYFVTNCDMTVVSKTYHLFEDAKMMGIDTEKIKLVINRVPKKLPINKSLILNKFQISITAEIQEDEEVLNAVNNGKTAVESPTCVKYIEGINVIVEDIINNTELKNKKLNNAINIPKKKGLFKLWAQ